MAEVRVLYIFLVTGGSSCGWTQEEEEEEEEEWWERKVLTFAATAAPFPPLERVCSN